jgi:hypothetical protein
MAELRTPLAPAACFSNTAVRFFALPAAANVMSVTHPHMNWRGFFEL